MLIYLENFEIKKFSWFSNEHIGKDTEEKLEEGQNPIH